MLHYSLSYDLLVWFSIQLWICIPIQVKLIFVAVLSPLHTPSVSVLLWPVKKGKIKRWMLYVISTAEGGLRGVHHPWLFLLWLRIFLQRAICWVYKSHWFRVIPKNNASWRRCLKVHSVATFMFNNHSLSSFWVPRVIFFTSACGGITVMTSMQLRDPR